MSVSGGYGCRFHLAPSFASPLTTLVTVLGSFRRSVGFLTFSLLAFEFVTLTLLYVTFVLVVTTFATNPTGDGTPEVILMVHCYTIFSALLSFQLQDAITAMIAVMGMARL